MTKRTNMTANIMETGPVKKTLITLGIPSIVAMMIMAVYNFADTYFIGMLNDTSSMGAVSITFPLVMIFSAIGQMIGVGGASYVGRTLGNKEYDLADKTASVSVVISIVLSIITTVIGLLCLTPILKALGASPTVLPIAIEYTRILFFGTIFTVMNAALTALVRAEGNSKLSMIALILGAVINIILDPIFMFVFKGGVAGAALATVIGQIVTTVYLLSYYLRKKSTVHLSLKYVSRNPLHDKGVYQEIFKIGIPVFLMQFLLSIASSLLNNAAMPYGDAAVAAMGVSNRIYMIPIYIMAGFNQGFQPFAAYNYGAKLYHRLNEGIKFTFILLGI
ncbi:MAG: MATE family efflux transporter, partial [Turicibacter sp.]